MHEEEFHYGKASYIGERGRLWERVCLVFEGLGYQPPRPDTPDGGGFVANIQNQYLADFSGTEILQIIEYARGYTVETLKQQKENKWIDREAVFGERSF